MRKFIWAAPLAIAAVIAGSGVAAAAAPTASAPSAISAPAVAAAPSALASSGIFAGMKVTPKKAARTARAQHTKSKVIEISLDKHRGDRVWEVTVVSKTGRWEVSVDTQTGKVVRDKVDDQHNRARDLKRWRNAEVRFAKALTIALAKHPGTGLDSIDLDREHGRLVWQVDLESRSGNQHELAISAKSGKILKDKLDRD